MEELESEKPECFDDLLDEVIEAILTPPASSVQIIRTWLLELFVRGIVNIALVKLKKIEVLTTLTDRRQLLLIRGRCNDRNYFRKQKTAVHNFSDFELPCLVWGASCLPKDEFETWIGTVKGSFNKPLGGLFLKWLAMKVRSRRISEPTHLTKSKRRSWHCFAAWKSDPIASTSRSLEAA